MVRSILSKSFLLLLPAVLPLIVASCMVGDFISAYFNTYYNAQHAFADAEEQIWSQPDTRNSGRNLLLPLNIPADAKAKLTSVIDKCSKLFQYHPTSKLLDDALLMVGKSFFYMSDFAGAERKFRELVQTYPQSDLALESRMYLAYALYKQGEPDAADTVAVGVARDAEEEGDAEVEAYSTLLLGQIRMDRKDYQGAQGYFATAGERAGDADLGTTAFLLAAEMHANVGDSTAALAAYGRALKRADNYVGEYKARIGQARMLSKLGRVDEEMELLDELRRNRNNKEFYGEIDLEKANAYRQQANYDFALNQYKYVDTAYIRTEAAVNADYQIGQMYEHELQNLDSAQWYYARGRTGGNLTIMKIGTALVQRSEVLNRFRLYRAILQQSDSIIHAWDKYSGDSLAWAQHKAAKADSSEKGNDTVAAMKDTLVAAGDTLVKPMPPSVVRDTARSHVAGAMNELATMFYADFEEPDSAVAWYQSLLQRFPGTPYTARAWFTEARIIAAADSVNGKRAADSLYRRLLAAYPQSEFAPEARRVLGLPDVVPVVSASRVVYEMGQSLYLKGNTREAIDTMSVIPRRFPKSPEAPRAAYAIGFMYENALHLPDSALAAYHRLAAMYPASSYAASIQARFDTTRVADTVAAPLPGAPGATATAAPGRPGAAPSMPVLTGRRARQQTFVDTTNVALPPSVQDSVK